MSLSLNGNIIKCVPEKLDLFETGRFRKKSGEGISSEMAEIEENFRRGLEAEAETVLREAEEKGYAEGFSRGQSEGRASVDELYFSASSALREAEEYRQAVFAETKNEVLDLAVSIAEKLVACKLELQPETIGSVVREALEAAQECSRITVYVNPGQVVRLRSVKDEIAPFLPEDKNFLIVGRPDLEMSDCIIDTEKGEIRSLLTEKTEKAGLVVKGEKL